MFAVITFLGWAGMFWSITTNTKPKTQITFAAITLIAVIGFFVTAFIQAG